MICLQLLTCLTILGSHGKSESLATQSSQSLNQTENLMCLSDASFCNAFLLIGLESCLFSPPEIDRSIWIKLNKGRTHCTYHYQIIRCFVGKLCPFV